MSIACLGRQLIFTVVRLIDARLSWCAQLFQLIKTIPKGGALHVHDSAAVSSDFIINNVTRREDLFMCVRDDDLEVVEFLFGQNKPEDVCFEPIDFYRDGVEDFDLFLIHQLTVIPPMFSEPDDPYQNPSVLTKKQYSKTFSFHYLFSYTFYFIHVLL